MTGTDLPTVTIGITAFNCKDTLRRAVASALKQNYINKEILIVDDCSSDGTHDIALELAANHKDIRVIRALKNGGVAASRNLIIKNTEADFIVFFDDDDVSEPNRISEQLKIIKACEQGDHTKLVISHTARLVTYSESLTRYEKALAQAAGPLGVSGPKVSEAILCGTNKKELRGACPTCSQMARVTTYLKLNGFDENLRRSEDTDFTIRAAECGATFVGIDVPVVQQFMTNDKSKSLTCERENWIYLTHKHRKIIERHMAFEFALSWLELRHQRLSQGYHPFLRLLWFLILRHPSQTFKKLYFAVPNIPLHSAMARFAKNNKEPK